MARDKPIDTSPRFIAVDLERQLLPGTFEHELDLSGFDARYRNGQTGAARRYRAASVWTAGLGTVDSAGSISDSRVSGAMSCSLGQVTAPNRMPTRLK